MKTALAALLALFATVLPSPARAADASGCKDSPLIARYPDSVITQCNDKLDELIAIPQQKAFEGELHATNYDFPKSVGKAGVYRNLKTALEKAGYSIPYDSGPINGDFAAHLGKTWILEEVSGSGWYKQSVGIETKLEQLVTADPNAHYSPMAAVAPEAGKDAAGCADSPFVTRYPKSTLTSCLDKPDDIAIIPVGTDRKSIEGEIHQLTYQFPKTASKAEVYRNLKTALQAAGFSVVYDTSPETGDIAVHSGKNWLYEEVSASGNYRQTIVIETQLAQEVQANADAMYGSLAKNGHAAVYGILFDTGKYDLKPASADALKEIVKLIKKEPTLKLYIVGHTDDVGDVASNLDLSRKRAAAVVHALVTEYGIAPAILDSFGAGPYAPVASNDKEAGGRSLNRRVELVKQ